jgi:hypothetical protein
MRKMRRPSVAVSFGGGMGEGTGFGAAVLSTWAVEDFLLGGKT